MDHLNDIGVEGMIRESVLQKGYEHIDGTHMSQDRVKFADVKLRVPYKARNC
jgi:hypothetical protein